MDDNIQQVLQIIKSDPKLGERIFNEPRGFSSVLNDLMPGMGKDDIRKRRRLAEAIDCGVYKCLKEHIGTNPNYAINHAVSLLEKEDISRSSAIKIVKVFSSLFPLKKDFSFYIDKQEQPIDESVKEEKTARSKLTPNIEQYEHEDTHSIFTIPVISRKITDKHISGTPPNSSQPARKIKDNPTKWPKVAAIAAVVLALVAICTFLFGDAILNKMQSDSNDSTLAVGDIIEFGIFDWLVLDVQDDKALIITEQIIDERAYHNEFEYFVTWETCDLRNYLNNHFYNSFPEYDQSRIIETKMQNYDNPWYGTYGGNATNDKIFLLSLDELVKYFGDSGALAQKQGKDIKYYYYDVGIKEVLIKPDTNEWCWFGEQYNSVRIANYGRKKALWWLRSPGDFDNGAAYVRGDGTVDVNGFHVRLDSIGVRPALWLKL